MPVQAYRRDRVSAGYRRLRAQAAVDGAARTRTAQARARAIAADLVAVHGADLIVEAGDLRAWARRWGRGMHAFTPGRLVTALHYEAATVAVHAGTAGLVRAGTRHTAWTQHCLCGIRVPKQLRHRRRTCPGCGLSGDRDLVAALVGAHTVLAEPGVPGSARIDWPAAADTLAAYGVDTINQGLQGALTESTGHHRPDRPPCAGIRRPQRSPGHHGRGRRARRTTGMKPATTPDQTHTTTRCGTTPDCLNNQTPVHETGLSP